MRMMILWISLIIQLIFGFAPILYGKTENVVLQKAKTLEAKSQIEDLISRRYRDQISTQIDSSLFSVSVKVTIKEVIEPQNNKNVPPPAPKPADKIKIVEAPKINNSEVKPEDLTTGFIELSPVLDHYKQQLEDLQRQLQAL